jgi:2-polyprenyl-3-methyl-5-hydroxy-6-metoxy-1,4-benzoquinol methylase
MSSPESPKPDPSIEDFVGEPTRDLSAWRWLWEGNHAFPVVSRRTGLAGQAERLLKRLARFFRPAVTLPQHDLWARQQTFNLIVLENLEFLQRAPSDFIRDLRQVRDDLVRDVQNNHRRITYLEAFPREVLTDFNQHTDALYALMDQRLDRQRRESKHYWSRLGSLLARVSDSETEPVSRAALEEVWKDQSYLELEDRFRGTREEISTRAQAYLGYLEGKGPILDLGCGRGEMLTVLKEHGLTARGTDQSEEMVAHCRGLELAADRGDLFGALEEASEGSLGGVLSLHVIEHLAPTDVDRLVRLAWRVLEPGGTLILETPNPLSLVVAARNFWLDPTHRRPVHPATLMLQFEQAGFDPVERLDLRPFEAEDRLPEIDLSDLPDEIKPVADHVNRLRDRLDELLYGFQDYAMIGTKPLAAD